MQTSASLPETETNDQHDCSHRRFSSFHVTDCSEFRTKSKVLKDFMEKNIRVYKIKGTVPRYWYGICPAREDRRMQRAKLPIQFVGKFYRYLFSNLE